MPLSRYGVLVAAAVDRRREGTTDTPHYQVHVRVPGGADFRIAVNVLSQLAPSELLYRLDDDLHHPVTGVLAPLAPGWHPLASRPGTGALDYIRGNLFDRAHLRTLPPDAVARTTTCPTCSTTTSSGPSGTPEPGSSPSASAGGPRTPCRTRSSGSAPATGCTTST
jgi:hypothetical protein